MASVIKSPFDKMNISFSVSWIWICANDAFGGGREEKGYDLAADSGISYGWWRWLKNERESEIKERNKSLRRVDLVMARWVGIIHWGTHISRSASPHSTTTTAYSTVHRYLFI